MSTARSTEALSFTLFENIPSEKNQKTGQVRKRTLRFDINALADFEQEAGMGFGQLMSTKAMFATCRALLWAGMRHEDRGITTTNVGAKIQEYMHEGGDINEILTAVFEICKKQGAFGKEEAVAYNETTGEKLLEDGNTIEGEAKAVPPSPSLRAVGPDQTEGQ